MVHLSIDPLSSPSGIDIDALNPPEGRVAPIAPFECDHQLAEDMLRRVLRESGNHEKTAVRGLEQGQCAFAESGHVELTALCFHCHGRAEGNDPLHVFFPGGPDYDLVRQSHECYAEVLGAESHPAAGL